MALKYRGQFRGIEEMKELESKIDDLKKELIRISELTGLNSPETLYCSQRLDELITIYQKRQLKHNKTITILS